MKSTKLFYLACLAALAAFTAIGAPNPTNGTLLFENLRKMGSSFGVDDPSVTAQDLAEGPKGLAAADLDGDGRMDLATGNKDGTVAVLFGKAGGGFEPVQFLHAGDPRGLRDVIAANVSGDGRPDIIAAHPFEGKLYIFSVSGPAGSRSFSAAQTLMTWPGARGLAAGDFDGDGKTDLAVGGAGDGFREYRGDGVGGFVAMPALSAIDPGPFRTHSAKPVFTMQAWRHPGGTRDRLAVSYAEAFRVWFLASPGPGQPLAVTSTLPLLDNESAYDLTMGYLSVESRTSGEPDLITAVTWSGEVFIRRFTGAPAGQPPYPVVPQQRLAVPGAPRALSIADVNGDSWPDLLVAGRTSNTLSLFVNSAGKLLLASQAPAGSSPRDVVSADFDGNGLPDAAVINRKSEDITLHRIDPLTGRFFQSPLVLPILGGATSASIRDLDGDGRGELLYLTPSTGEANIRKVDAASRWLLPARYAMGARPQSLQAVDMDGDGLLDLLAARLGDAEDPGGLSYRRQLPDHTFGPLMGSSTPGGQSSAMLWDTAGDFDGDGLMDQVSVYFDCRISFFQGTLAGLVHRRTELFLYESRSVAAVDLDGDGDLDIVGSGAFGDVAVVKNHGRWFTGGPYWKTTLTGGEPLPGAYAVIVEDGNGDGDPDLTVFSPSAISHWKGGPGLTFVFDSTIKVSPTLSVVRADFDGDGITDTFALCPANTTATFFPGPSNGNWWLLAGPFEPFSVPAVSSLAAGDLDGDGRADLAGVGEFLWAALSGTPAPPPVPTASVPPPVEIPSVVINEVLSSTTDFIAPGVTKPTDCVEIFNGTGAPVNLAGWKLRREVEPEETPLPDFQFPSFLLAPGAIAVVFCSDKNNPWHAPFKLPESGCTLRLLNAAGAESDTLTYFAQQPDISLARLFDGSRTLVSSPFPSIGATNYDNGNTNPKIEFKGMDSALLKLGRWRFRAQAVDDSGMFTLLISWREITTSASPRSGVVPLYDDGMHDDGASLDGVFTGDMIPPLPPGVAIEFYITGTDLRGESATRPDSPQFATAGQPIENYTLAIPTTPTGWEISEVVSRNVSLVDETGVNTPDWAELRYAGPGTAPVQDLYLSDSMFGYDVGKLYDVSRIGATVSPGNSRIVFLDDTPFDAAKPRHAHFGVNADDGDSIYLIRRLPSGATEFVDSVKVPPLNTNVAYARLGVGGPFVQTLPTPEGPNARAGGSVHVVPGMEGGRDAIFAFRGGGSVEASFDLTSWYTVLPWVSADAVERLYREPVQSSRRFFRVR